MKAFYDNKYNIVLKSRQMGISTLVAGYIMYKMLFEDEFKVLVIATKQDVAKNLVQKIQLMFDMLPPFIKSGVEIKNNNKLELVLSNGSSVKAVSSSPSAGRSEALSLLVIDEAAFIENFDPIWTAAQSTLSTGGDAIILSTPNGTGGLFYKLWAEAEAGDAAEGLDKFNPIKLKWNLHPERDQKWRDQQDTLIGKRSAAQECDAEFLTSGHSVIESEILQEMEKQCIDPVEKRGMAGDIWIFSYALPNYDYIATVDVARGDGSDYSTVQIFNVESMEQVAEFKGKVDTQTLGRLSVSLATEYNNALLVIDNKNVGWSTVQYVIDSGYTNLYYSFKEDPFLDPAIHIIKNYDLKNKEDMTPGMTIDVKLRPVLISKLEIYCLENPPVIRSRRTMNELKVFIWSHGKAQAQNGHNDDLVIALCMFLFTRDTSLRLRQLGIEITKASAEAFKRSIYKTNTASNPAWNMNVGNKVESLKWLL